MWRQVCAVDVRAEVYLFTLIMKDPWQSNRTGHRINPDGSRAVVIIKLVDISVRYTAISKDSCMHGLILKLVVRLDYRNIVTQGICRSTYTGSRAELRPIFRPRVSSADGGLLRG